MNRRNVWLIGLAAPCLLGATAGAAHASKVTFEGNCSFKAVQIRLNDGLAAFDDGPANGTMAGPGICSGTINERQIDQRVSTLDLQISGHGSCGFTAAFTGSGIFKVDGVELPVKMTLTKPNSTIEVIFDLYGMDSGHAGGRGEGDASGAIAPAEPSIGSFGCYTGNARATAINVPFSTETPLVSTVPDPPAVPPARLGLTATDQRAATVRRTGVVRTQCTVPAGGRCRVVVARGTQTLATGSATGAAGRPVAVAARLTRAGRRALRRGRMLRTTVRATAPGLAPRSRAIVLR